MVTCIDVLHPQLMSNNNDSMEGQNQHGAHVTYWLVLGFDFRNSKFRVHVLYVFMYVYDRF